MKTLPGVILVRPQLSAITDMQLCREAGWNPILLEYLNLKPDLLALTDLSAQCLNTDVMLWNSPATVYLAEKFVPKNLQCIHVAVGKASANTLYNHGFTQIVYPEDGCDSEAVARLPLWLQQKGKFLLVKGMGGRNWLPSHLKTLGWEVEVAEVYERIPQLLDWSMVKKEKNLQAIYLTTTAAVKAWFGQLPPDLHTLSKSLLYLVHHPRIVDALRQYEVSIKLVSNLQRGLDFLHSCRKE